MVSYYSRFIDVDGELHHAGDFLITRNKIIMDAVVLIMIIWFALVSLVTFFFFDEGTKGIEKRPYFGKYSGRKYTAKKDREKHIV